ncbi:protein dpy-30 [Trypanosoma grayi]|uniref:protein dpy-30 n=1 Tax=Trypanosoma grayi TaxID=71804 RepID=UPI0004F455CD|nr:protein dpy-30 [Trypanosoma grayi]KEG11827.1 protein dpy-30 [Trypanosoma grayi]
MSKEQSLRAPSVFDAARHAATGVFIAYADTYLGKRLFDQFRHAKSSSSSSSDNNNNSSSSSKGSKCYKLFACTWDRDAAEQLAKEEAAATAAAKVDAASSGHGDDGHGDEGNGDGGESNDSNSGAPAPAATTAVAISSTGVEEANNNNNSSSDNHTHVFWRGDTMELRNALLEADCIVMELRQAQDVFDMMHVLTTKELLKPKRVIVVSSLLTWYATPPLQMEPMGESSSNNNNRNKNEEEEEEESMEEREEEPQPLDKRETEALLGPADERGSNNGDDDDNNNDDGEAVELFTEDQYNRRIPHAKYFNWREAERVVAAANGDERHLHTCVIFAGLPYGDGEDALESFFTQAWSRKEKGLPVYGDGTQIVPTVHVRDLVTFTQRLLEAEAPPALRYVFAVDGGTVSWRRMVQTVNRAFGGEETFHVPPEDFVLHHNVELFTMNMRVDNQTMRDIMPEDEDWVAQSGFVNNIEKVTFEYIKAHKLEPIRIAILGPPLAGKTCLAEALAQRHYKLPRFTMERVLEEYKEHIARLKERLEQFRRRLFEREKTRREELKKRIFLRPRARTEGGEEEEAEDEGEAEQQGQSDAPMGDMGSSRVNVGNKRRHTTGDEDMEDKEVKFTLTEEEVQDVETLVEEWYQQNDRVAQLRETIAAMERVLLMKVRVQLPAPAEGVNASNPKKRKENAKTKRPSRTANKKAAGDEEEPSVEAQENAPFQDKALALMMRWRLSRADCRNQGYVLDGFPETVAQARLVFGDAPLEVPETVEEATGAGASHPSHPVTPTTASANAAPPTVEPCEEERLPSFVFVLEAADNFLLERLTAVSKAAGELVGVEEKRLARFEEAMTQYRRQFVDTEYSLPNFFECARTVARTLTPGDRAAKVVAVKVDAEPLLLPPPPESAFEIVAPSNVETIICQHVGEPHNLGPTPQEQFAEITREGNLAEEKQRKELKALMDQRELEKLEYIRESEERSHTESVRRAIEKADLQSLEKRKVPLRLYLQRNIMPLLSKGLVEVCKTRPEDPVDFLAEWLARHNPLDDSCFDL